MVEEGNIVWVRGNVGQDRRRDEDENQEIVRQIQINEVIEINEVIDTTTSSLEISIQKQDLENQEKLEKLLELCNSNQGGNDLILRLTDPKFGEIIAQCNQRYSLPNSETVINKVEGLFGEGSIKPSHRTKRSGEQPKFALNPW